MIFQLDFISHRKFNKYAGKYCEKSSDSLNICENLKECVHCHLLNKGTSQCDMCGDTKVKTVVDLGENIIVNRNTNLGKNVGIIKAQCACPFKQKYF